MYETTNDSLLPMQSYSLSEEDAEMENAFLKEQRAYVLDEEQIKKGFLIKPICDLFVAMFSLKKSRSSWLRGRALLVVIQQLLGGTIEKYVKDSIERITSKESIQQGLSRLRSTIWVDGVLPNRASNDDKSSNSAKEEPSYSAWDSKEKLEILLAETCGKVVGLKSSRKAAAELHGMIQNKYLNASLVLDILDLILAEMFPGDL